MNETQRFSSYILGIVLLVALFVIPIFYQNQGTALLIGTAQQNALDVLNEYDANVRIVQSDIVKLDRIIMKYNPAYNPLDYRVKQSGTYLPGGFNVRPARVIESANAFAREYKTARPHFVDFQRFLEQNKEVLISLNVDVLMDSSQIEDVISNYDVNLESMKNTMREYEQREDLEEMQYLIKKFWEYANKIQQQISGPFPP